MFTLVLVQFGHTGISPNLLRLIAIWISFATSPLPEGTNDKSFTESLEPLWVNAVFVSFHFKKFVISKVASCLGRYGRLLGHFGGAAVFEWAYQKSFEEFCTARRTHISLHISQSFLL